MPSAASLVKKVAKAIKKVGPMSRTSYKRQVMRQGGDVLIGRTVNTYNIDTLFDPQPIYRQLGHRQAMYLSTASLQLVSDDFKFTFPTTQVSQADFQGPDVYIVLKDGNGEERFRILYIGSADFKGADIVTEVFARSMGQIAPTESV